MQFENEISYLEWLNKEPRTIKENKDGSKYVPISVVQEDLFDTYNGNTRFELIREIIVKSGLAGIGRLHYKNPVTLEWLYQDGSASIPFKSGMRLDFPALGGHIMLNCAKKIGKRFGQFLNRELDDAPLAVIVVDKKEPNNEEERMRTLLMDCKTKEEVETYKLLVPAKLKKLFNSLLKKLPNATS